MAAAGTPLFSSLRDPPFAPQPSPQRHGERRRHWGQRLPPHSGVRRGAGWTSGARRAGAKPSRSWLLVSSAGALQRARHVGPGTPRHPPGAARGELPALHLRKVAAGERLQEGLRGMTPCPPHPPLRSPFVMPMDSGEAGLEMQAWCCRPLPPPLPWEQRGAVAGQLGFRQRLWAGRCRRAEGTARVPLGSPLPPLPPEGDGGSCQRSPLRRVGGRTAVRRG